MRKRGEDEQRWVKSERHMIQNNAALIPYHTSLLFSVDELNKCWINAVKFSMLCLGLPGNFVAVFPCLQDRIWIFRASSNTHGRSESAAVLHSCPLCTHTLYKAGLTYNGHICMSVIHFDLHTVIQSQLVSELGTLSDSDNKCCRRRISLKVGTFK